MAAINKDKNTALAALTSAALALPGLNTQGAIPSANIKSNVSYGHYQESDDRMQVDVYHADAVIPLSDRLEVAFSLDRDTYSGATPAFSIPESVTNLPKYKQKDDGTTSNEVSYVDLVSAASGGVSSGGLTILGGLNGFQEFDSNLKNATAEISANLNNSLTQLATDRDTITQALEAAFNASANNLKTEYEANLAALNAGIPALTTAYNSNRAALESNLASVPATIGSAVTVNFSDMGSPSYSGFANESPISGGNCSGTGTTGCYYQGGMVIGIVKDTSNSLAHLHNVGTSNLRLGYHSDSSGIYIRALDSSAFSLTSLRFRAPASQANPDANGTYIDPDTDEQVTGVADPQNDYWEILGFNTARNPNLGQGDGTNYATRVAHQTVTNGFNNTLLLNSGFQNIKAFWIHYHGYPHTPNDGKKFAMELDDIVVTPVAAYTNLTALYNQQLTDLQSQYETDLANLASNNPVALSNLINAYNNNLAALTSNYEAAVGEANLDYTNGVAQQNAIANNPATQRALAIAFYRQVLNKMVPKGTPTVQRFQVQPQETRSMPQFTARYYFDATTLSFSGGLSDEPDFLSNFGSVNVSHEFNDKLTTVSAGYGLTSNTITRGGGHAGHGGHEGHDDYADYPDLNEESTFHSFNASISQVLSKNTLFQSSANFTNQSGYLSNPYKFVYVRGEVTPEEYYNLWQAEAGTVDWNSLTRLEMVGLELFRENRPDERNLWSFSNRLNQYIPQLDASVHLDYRFYTDDWGIDSHTFELKWYQNLPQGWTITPGIRYYSQSQADFFAPYFLAPRADGNYSSDFRLSAFGDLGGGVTVSKAFARGIKLEAGIEYVTHAGSLKLGGGGVGDYADFDYYIAHANLNVELSARPFTVGGAGDHHMHHHHHGAPIPAGVMFGHMMSQADEIMIGYRYQYGVQSGSMLNGSDQVSDAFLVSNACPGSDNGCLYKPTKMHMQMHMLDLMYAPTDWLNIMVMPQLMSMDMTMSKPIRELTGDEAEDNLGAHGGTKHNSNDIGDTLAVAMFKIMDEGGHHLHAGLGMSAPTGSIDAELTQGSLKNTAGTEIEPGSAVLQDYGMQLGSGTWDFKPSLTYTGQLGDWGWGTQLSGTKRLEKNKYGYAYGDVFQATSWGSYAIFSWLSASLRGVYTWQDRIRGETDQNHQTLSPVDFPSNYGGRFWDVGLGLNASIAEGRFAGHNLSVEWLQPVATDFNGSQLDRDGALAATWSFSF